MDIVIVVVGQRKPSREADAGEGEDDEVTLADTSLFMLELYTFLALDKYVSHEEHSIPFVVHSTVTDRVNALLKERYVNGSQYLFGV